MTTTARSTALVMIQPAFTDAERLALAGFLAGYRGLTREAYALDLRQFTTWCRARSLGLFAVRRADIESFARELEARGRARATVTRRLCTIARFYRYAVEEELLDHSPARPRKVRSGKNRSRSPSRGSGSARLAPHQSSSRPESAGWMCDGTANVTFCGWSCPGFARSGDRGRAVCPLPTSGRLGAGRLPQPDRLGSVRYESVSSEAS